MMNDVDVFIEERFVNGFQLFTFNLVRCLFPIDTL